MVKSSTALTYSVFILKFRTDRHYLTVRVNKVVWNKVVLKTNYCLIQVKSIAECSKGSILQYFHPSLSYHLLSLNAGQKYCRMLQGEHSAILLTFIKLPFVIKIFVMSIFEWLFYTGFTVLS